MGPTQTLQSSDKDEEKEEETNVASGGSETAAVKTPAQDLLKEEIAEMKSRIVELQYLKDSKLLTEKDSNEFKRLNPFEVIILMGK